MESRCLFCLPGHPLSLPFHLLRFGCALKPQRLRKIAAAEGLVNTAQHYLIKPTETKGLGAFATRDIAPGTVVISEPPIVVTREDSVNLAYDSLNDAQKRLFMSFTRSPQVSEGSSSSSGSGSGNKKSTASAAELVFQNNAYTWDAADPRGELAGLFPTLPRFNHDCSPNLTYQSDFEQGRGCFVAIVPVKAGQELCTSYCDRTDPRRARQKRLKDICATAFSHLILCARADPISGRHSCRRF